MGHASRLIASAAIAAALLPPSRAADDVASLKAEIAALKADYAERVTSLETRIGQLESAQAATVAAAPAEPPPPLTPSAPSRNSTAFNPSISVILAGNYADLSQDPGTWHLAGLHAWRCRDRSRRSQLQSRRVRADVRSERRSVLHRTADRGAHGRQRNRRRGGVLPHDVAARGLLDQGRAVLLRLRLPQRDPRARVGLRRPAARRTRPSSAGSTPRTACR